ncbi:unnamed protein product [Spirodela intermedia]|uniref:Uncharacterized protein n=1 Tax=Spirodela intermedia TaxID=51605 RepID=A0A7I8K5J5_SPIIN|nr:unnamed protein product [Spirodela intermedia]
MEECRRREEAHVGCTLAALMAGFTLLLTGLGFACAATAHVALVRHQVHGGSAVFLYKAVRWAGLAVMGLPYVVDLLLLVFLIALRCRRRPCPPAAAAKAALDAGYRPRPAADRVDWDAIRAPTYEYLAEVVRILSREDHVAEASPIV